MGIVCESCGMDMVGPQDFAQGNVTRRNCTECCDESGVLLSEEEIRAELIERFMESEGVDQLEAEEMVDAHMKTLPAWQSEEE